MRDPSQVDAALDALLEVERSKREVIQQAQLPKRGPRAEELLEAYVQAEARLYETLTVVFPEAFSDAS